MFILNYTSIYFYLFEVKIPFKNSLFNFSPTKVWFFDFFYIRIYKKNKQKQTFGRLVNRVNFALALPFCFAQSLALGRCILLAASLLCSPQCLALGSISCLFPWKMNEIILRTTKYSHKFAWIIIIRIMRTTIIIYNNNII